MDYIQGKMVPTQATTLSIRPVLIQSNLKTGLSPVTYQDRRS